MEVNKLYNDDCVKIMTTMEYKSIDCIIVDPPYGTTAAAWDKILPMNDYVIVGKKSYQEQDYLLYCYRKGIAYDTALQQFNEQKQQGIWSLYERVIKDDGAIVIFGSEPFSTKLRASNPKLYKYDWIWKKSTVDGFFNAQCRPLKTVEMISVFSKSEARAKGNNMRYYPQGLTLVNKACKDTRQQGESDGHKYFRQSTDNNSYVQKYTNYPTEILEYARDSKKAHPTQKPVALLEYLIKTYTTEGDVVLDNCMGSGSTVIAAINTNRKYIGIEKDAAYFKIAQQRVGEIV